VSGDEAHPALEELEARLAEEERAYGELLARLDALAALALPAERTPEAQQRLAALNELWSPPLPPAGKGLGAALRRCIFAASAPARERQTAFNSALVQLLNLRLQETDRLHEQLRALSSALVRYAQRVQPLVDARARLAAALATTRSELVLDAFSRQLESHARRVDALAALGERLDGLAAELAARRASG